MNVTSTKKRLIVSSSVLRLLFVYVFVCDFAKSNSNCCRTTRVLTYKSVPRLLLTAVYRLGYFLCVVYVCVNMEREKKDI